MANEYKSTWDHMAICFPEWRADMEQTEFDHYFPVIPNFTNEQVSFAYKNDYGVQMYFNDTIGSWLQTPPERTKKMITKIHSDLSHKLYGEVLKELDDSIETIEGWRKFISRNKNGIWEGNLQDSLDFRNGRETVTLWDYYKFYINSDSKENSPSSTLNKISKLPVDSLNEKWKEYYEFAIRVLDLGDDDTSNAIIGKNIGECIKNADEIYKMADELRELKF